jgi:T1SS-143 domain-containing protein
MAQIATVTGVVGTVFAIAPNGTVRTLKVGDTLQQGEIVRTGANARVELAMADGAATAATTTAGAANGNVAIGSNAIVKVDDNMALGDARPTAQEAAVGIQAIQQVLQALEAGGDLTEELEAAAAGIAGGDGDGAGSDFVQLARVQLDTDSLSYAFDTAQGGSVELFETGTDVLPEITLGVVAVPDDAPTVQASTNAVLSEADLRVPESGSTVAVGTLVSFSAVPVVAGGTVASVSGSPETAGPGNRLRVVDPASGAQLVKVTNPTDQAMEFEWRDPSGTAYAKGLVASGEVVYLANDSYGGNRAMQLFVRLPGDSVWTGRNRGSLAVDDAASVDFVFPVAVEGVSFLGQLNFNAGADGGRITALSGEGVVGLTSGGQPVVFTSTTSADGSSITLTGTAAGKAVLTVQVDTASGAYTATLLAPLDHPLADQSGAADPLDLELGYTVTDADGDTATGSFTVTVRDDAPTVQPSAGVTLDEHSLVPDGPSGTVVTGRLVDVGDVTVLAGAGPGSVTGSTLTTGPGNTIRLIDPVTGHQMVQVKNPTGQAIEFEWRDNRASVGTVYAKGTVESGEVLFVSTTAHLGTPTIVLFARFAGVGEFVRAKGQGTLAGTSAATEDYPSPLPDPASPLDPGAGTPGLDPGTHHGAAQLQPGRRWRADCGTERAGRGWIDRSRPTGGVCADLPGGGGRPARGLCGPDWQRQRHARAGSEGECRHRQLHRHAAGSAGPRACRAGGGWERNPAEAGTGLHRGGWRPRPGRWHFRGHGAGRRGGRQTAGGHHQRRYLDGHR